MLVKFVGNLNAINAMNPTERGGNSFAFIALNRTYKMPT